MSTVSAIVHDGIVVSCRPSEGVARVRVLHEGADCSGCAAAFLCKRDSTDIITVSTAGYTLVPGSQVRLGISAAGHLRAVGLMLGLPCMLLILTIVLALLFGLSEGFAALCGIGVAGASYIVMYMLRHRPGMNIGLTIISADEA